MRSAAAGNRLRPQDETAAALRRLKVVSTAGRRQTAHWQGVVQAARHAASVAAAHEAKTKAAAPELPPPPPPPTTAFMRFALEAPAVNVPPLLMMRQAVCEWLASSETQRQEYAAEKEKEGNHVVPAAPRAGPTTRGLAAEKQRKRKRVAEAARAAAMAPPKGAFDSREEFDAALDAAVDAAAAAPAPKKAAAQPKKAGRRPKKAGKGRDDLEHADFAAFAARELLFAREVLALPHLSSGEFLSTAVAMWRRDDDK
jgi:hypothetical protein